MKIPLFVILLISFLSLSAQNSADEAGNKLTQDRRDFLAQIDRRLPMEVDKGIIWKSAKLNDNTLTFTYLVLKNGPHLKGVSDRGPVIERLKTMPVDKLIPGMTVTDLQERLNADININLKIAGWWQQDYDESEVIIPRKFPRQLQGKIASKSFQSKE